MTLRERIYELPDGALWKGLYLLADFLDEKFAEKECKHEFLLYDVPKENKKVLRCKKCGVICGDIEEPKTDNLVYNIREAFYEWLENETDCPDKFECIAKMLRDKYEIKER